MTATATGSNTNNNTISSSNNTRTIILVVLISILIQFIYTFIDANITLFVWDLWLTTISYSYSFSSSSSSIHINKKRYSKLKNKTIWVTGASSGIGAELTCQLLQAEVKHVILSARRQDSLERVVNNCLDSINNSNNNKDFIITTTTKISFVTYDANYPEQSNKVVQNVLNVVTTQNNDDRIDIIILNAGIYQLELGLDTTFERTKQIMKINFESPVAITREIILQDQWKEKYNNNNNNNNNNDRSSSSSSDSGIMNTKNKPHIVVVSSIIGRGTGNALTSSYAASKHALMGYFHSLSTETSNWLRIDIVCPGATDTNMWNAMVQLVRSNNNNEHNNNKEINDNNIDDDNSIITTTSTSTTPSTNSNKQQQNDNNNNNNISNIVSSYYDYFNFKMSTKRCSQLILSSILGSHIFFYESWITKQPGLLYVYVSSYLPDIHYHMIHFFGTLRIIAYNYRSTTQQKDNNNNNNNDDDNDDNHIMKEDAVSMRAFAKALWKGYNSK